MNPLRLRPDRFFNLIYVWHIRRVKPEDHALFEESLTEPLPVRPGAVIRNPTPMELEDEGAGFMALYAQVRGG